MICRSARRLLRQQVRMTALYELIAPAHACFLDSVLRDHRLCHAARSADDSGGRKKMIYISNAFESEAISDQIKTRIARVQRGLGACALGVRMLTFFFNHAFHVRALSRISRECRGINQMICSVKQIKLPPGAGLGPWPDRMPRSSVDVYLFV